MTTMVKDINSLVGINEKAYKSICNIFEGKIPSDQLDDMTASLEKMTQRYHYQIRVVGAVFYFHIWIFDEKHEFNGNAGVSALVSAINGAGDIYTDDIDKLYGETVSFSFESAGPYFSVQFFNKEHKLLGHLQAGGLGNPGIGGGTGKWKNRE
ncbi:MAG TPA: VapA/VapB family virulence-associated protein [Desulfosporosinus sp.]|nr:VapA/VapB family virulence-associated protein [Desulfosporosinus sp.]